MRESDWSVRLSDESIKIPLQIVVTLDMDRDEARKQRLDPATRERLIGTLPRRLVALHHAWRGREDPFPNPVRVEPGRKVGRNERCPCGSGKKYKHCCGAAHKRSSS